jgi:hypothetical protein
VNTDPTRVPRPAEPIDDATLNHVRAAVHAGRVGRVTIFCDECGREETGDYMGATERSRFEAARRHLAEAEGGGITDLYDLCPQIGLEKLRGSLAPYPRRHYLGEVRQTSKIGAPMTVWPDTELSAVAERVARYLYENIRRDLHIADHVSEVEWVEFMGGDERRRDLWLQRGLDLVNMVSQAMQPAGTVTHPDRLWSLIDWSLYAWGVGDVLRERAADTFVRTLPAADAEHIRFLMGLWEETHKHPRVPAHLNRDLYDKVKALRADIAEKLLRGRRAR